LSHEVKQRNEVSAPCARLSEHELEDEPQHAAISSIFGKLDVMAETLRT